MLYAIYRGDTFVDVGTAKELAMKYNIKKSTVYFYSSPYYHNLVKDKINRRVVYKIGVNMKTIELELERYNELLKSEQELETLKELIFNNVRYAGYKDDITIDDDSSIMEYLKVIETDTFLELYMMLKLHEKMKDKESEEE